jgi:organic radical activating enzyme
MGKTHSCHHPSPHVIPITEIKKNPAALHDSEYKKEQRRLMLSKGRPEECSYCWKVEDTSTFYSDRTLTSSKFDFIKDYRTIKNSSWQDPAKLRMLEVSFSNVCNLACAYCGPQYSSKWAGEIASKGPYVQSDNYNEINFNQYLDKDENPYIEAFWEYLPTVYSGLKTLRITGGEPLLSRHTDALFKFILNNPNKKMEVVINTNLSVSRDILYKFIENLKLIKHNVKKIKIATSCESTGARAEYIRDGLIYDVWLENCELYLKEHIGPLQIMSTFNILSITSFSEFLTDIIKLKKKYKKITISISYLNTPEFMSAHLAPKEYIVYLNDSLKLIKNNFNSDAFHRFEQVILYFLNGEENKENLNFLRSFIYEYDSRRKKDFSSTFPEYKFI